MYLIHINSLAPQLMSRHLNLPHQFFVCLGHIVECVYAPAKLEEEIGTEGHYGPERELRVYIS